MIELRRLALLRELSLRGTMAATAEAVHLTGPAVSQQLATLEREAGIPLLVKNGRTVSLTAAGELLVAHSGVLLGHLAAAEADLAALRNGTHGVLRVAAFPSAARAIVPWLWNPRAVTAGLDLQLLEAEPEQAVPALISGEVEVAIVHDYNLLPRDLPDCDRVNLLDDPVRLAFHPDDALERGFAPNEPVQLSAFADVAWLLPGPHTSCHEMTQRACGAAGFVPRAIAQATDFSVLAALVEAGAGVALMPSMAIPPDRSRLSLHPLLPPITRTVSVLARHGESGRPTIRRVLDGLHDAAAHYRRPELSG